MTPYLTDPDAPYAWFIERATGRQVVRLLHDLKELREQGWEATALLAPDGSVVGMAVGYCAMTRARLSQLSLLSDVPA